MTKPQFSTEPSMDDILASIRKMISEERLGPRPIPDQIGRSPFGESVAEQPLAGPTALGPNFEPMLAPAERAPSFSSLSDALKAATPSPEERRTLEDKIADMLEPEDETPRRPASRDQLARRLCRHPPRPCECARLRPAGGAVARRHEPDGQSGAADVPHDAGAGRRCTDFADVATRPGCASGALSTERTSARIARQPRLAARVPVLRRARPRSWVRPRSPSRSLPEAKPAEAQAFRTQGHARRRKRMRSGLSPCHRGPERPF